VVFPSCILLCVKGYENCRKGFSYGVQQVDEMVLDLFDGRSSFDFDIVLRETNKIISLGFEEYHEIEEVWGKTISRLLLNCLITIEENPPEQKKLEDSNKIRSTKTMWSP